MVAKMGRHLFSSRGFVVEKCLGKAKILSSTAGRREADPFDEIKLIDVFLGGLVPHSFYTTSSHSQSFLKWVQN
jgi:hypothetical protein